MNINRSVLIIQEILPSYRISVFDQIAQLSRGKVTIFADSGTADYGKFDLHNYRFKFVNANWKKYLKIFKCDFDFFHLWKKHDVIFHVADFKFLSLWFILFFSLFTSKKVFLHGQGGYKNSGLIINIVYFLITIMCDGYICYTEFSKNALKRKIPSFLHPKISVCDNTLDISTVDKIYLATSSKSFFYIGRLRPGCDIEILLQAAINAQVHIKIIGTGDEPYLTELKDKYSSVATFYGAIFDEAKQRDIAYGCIAGVYGGDAGLSVVHYMALALPVVVHNDIEKHMGPEPSYVKDNANGLLFERGNVESLTDKLLILVGNKDLRDHLAINAITTFNKLKTPSMAEKFVNIMELS